MIRALAVVLVLLLTVSVFAGTVPYWRDFTPTSGIEFSDDGGFSLGVEAFYMKTSPSDGFNCSRKTVKLPAAITELAVFGGTISLRPPAPRNGRVFFTDGLFRVYLGSRQIVNVILKSENGAVNIPVMPFKTKVRPWETVMTVEFQLAGASEPTSAEMQLVGEWTNEGQPQSH